MVALLFLSLPQFSDNLESGFSSLLGRIRKERGPLGIFTPTRVFNLKEIITSEEVIQYVFFFVVVY